MPKVFCIGDSSVNVFLQIPKAAENTSVENEKRLMQFKLGSKTQLESEVVTVGGNAFNVAVGLNRQGIETELLSILGNDMDGDRILQFLDEEVKRLKLKGKSLSLKLKIEKKEDVKTNVGYVVSFQSERFLLIDTSPKSYRLSTTDYRLQTTDWLFLSSVGPNYEEFFKQVLELKSKIGFKLAYNPSSNELKNEVGTFIEMVKASDVLFANKKEGNKIIVPLFHCSIAEKTEELTRKLWEATHKLVVVTDGKRGSWVYDGEKIYYEAASDEEAVEKTGAGDAYESGFLAEFLKTGDIQAAMKNGTLNAGSVIKYVGAVEGLLYK